jgi:hypothetical protein
MPNKNITNLKYPIGEYDYQQEVKPADIREWINQIDAFPREMRQAVSGLSKDRLDLSYRPGGWNIRQLVQHVCDSHLNGYIRFKLALTEDLPTIKPYDQEKWAELADYDRLPVNDSLEFLELLHKRWVVLLHSMSTSDFERELNHPESGVLSLKTYLGAYAWHCRHHLAHITGALQRSH